MLGTWNLGSPFASINKKNALVGLNEFLMSPNHARSYKLDGQFASKNQNVFSLFWLSKFLKVHRQKNN